MMSNDILEKFNKAKQEAIDNPPKKVKGCKSCKKKNEVVELPEISFIEEPLIVFDEDNIVKAYYEVVRRDGIREESKVFINDVYKQLFNEEFIFDKCISCKNKQYHKFRNYILYNLKVNV
jgi:hypothetical protein